MSSLSSWTLLPLEVVVTDINQYPFWYSYGDSLRTAVRESVHELIDDDSELSTDLIDVQWCDVCFITAKDLIDEDSDSDTLDSALLSMCEDKSYWSVAETSEWLSSDGLLSLIDEAVVGSTDANELQLAAVGKCKVVFDDSKLSQRSAEKKLAALIEERQFEVKQSIGDAMDGECVGYLVSLTPSPSDASSDSVPLTAASALLAVTAIGMSIFMCSLVVVMLARMGETKATLSSVLFFGLFAANFWSCFSAAILFAFISAPLFTLGLGAIVFALLYDINSAVALFNKWTIDEGVVKGQHIERWMEDHSCAFYTVSLMTGSSLMAFDLFNSHLFEGAPMFDLGLDKRRTAVYELFTERLTVRMWLLNLPTAACCLAFFAHFAKDNDGTLELAVSALALTTNLVCAIALALHSSVWGPTLPVAESHSQTSGSKLMNESSSAMHSPRFGDSSSQMPTTSVAMLKVKSLSGDQSAGDLELTPMSCTPLATVSERKTDDALDDRSFAVQVSGDELLRKWKGKLMHSAKLGLAKRIAPCLHLREAQVLILEAEGHGNSGVEVVFKVVMADGLAKQSLIDALVDAVQCGEFASALQDNWQLSYLPDIDEDTMATWEKQLASFSKDKDKFRVSLLLKKCKILADGFLLKVGDAESKKFKAGALALASGGVHGSSGSLGHGSSSDTGSTASKGSKGSGKRRSRGKRSGKRRSHGKKTRKSRDDMDATDVVKSARSQSSAVTDTASVARAAAASMASVSPMPMIAPQQMYPMPMVMTASGLRPASVVMRQSSEGMIYGREAAQSAGSPPYAHPRGGDSFQAYRTHPAPIGQRPASGMSPAMSPPMNPEQVAYMRHASGMHPHAYSGPSPMIEVPDDALAAGRQLTRTQATSLATTATSTASTTLFGDGDSERFLDMDLGALRMKHATAGKKSIISGMVAAHSVVTPPPVAVRSSTLGTAIGTLDEAREHSVAEMTDPTISTLPLPVGAKTEDDERRGSDISTLSGLTAETRVVHGSELGTDEDAMSVMSGASSFVVSDDMSTIIGTEHTTESAVYSERNLTQLQIGGAKEKESNTEPLAEECALSIGSGASGAKQTQVVVLPPMCTPLEASEQMSMATSALSLADSDISALSVDEYKLDVLPGVRTVGAGKGVFADERNLSVGSELSMMSVIRRAEEAALGPETMEQIEERQSSESESETESDTGTETTGSALTGWN